SQGNSLTWHDAGALAGAGNLIDWNHRLFTGDYNGDGKSDAAYYDSSDGSWWFGISDGNSLNWHAAGSAAAYGNLLLQSHLLFGGDFAGIGKSGHLAY